MKKNQHFSKIVFYFQKSCVLLSLLIMYRLINYETHQHAEIEIHSKYTLQGREAVYEQRRKTMQDACKFLSAAKKDDYQQYYKDTDHLYFSRSKKVFGCIINKVASTSLLFALLKADRFNTTGVKAPYSIAYVLQAQNDTEFQSVLETYYKFIFVRNPLDRLLSCYLEKFVQRATNYTQDWSDAVRKEGRKLIVKKQRPRNNISIATSKNSKNKTTATFEEFLEFVLASDKSGEGFASHWVSYFRECSPCHYNYTMIGKLETASDDFNFLWKKSGMDKKIPITRRNKARTSLKKENLYSQIPRQLLVDIYQYFKPDFLIFGYDIDELFDKIGYEKLKEDEK